MSTIAPAKEDIWEYERSGFYVTVISQDKKSHRHKRANARELNALFHPSAGQPPRTDPTAHWYNAQCLHYGLKPSSVKGTAHKRLLEALNKEHLIVPSWIRKIERKLKRDWDARVVASQASTRQDRRDDAAGQLSSSSSSSSSRHAKKQKVSASRARDPEVIVIDDEPPSHAPEPAVASAARKTNRTVPVPEGEARKRKRKRDKSRPPSPKPGSVLNTLPTLIRDSPRPSEALQRKKKKKQKRASNDSSKENDDRSGPDRTGRLPTRIVRIDGYMSPDPPVPISAAAAGPSGTVPLRQRSQTLARRPSGSDRRISFKSSSSSSSSSLSPSSSSSESSDEEDDLPLLPSRRNIRPTRPAPAVQPQRVPLVRATRVTPPQSPPTAQATPLVPVATTPSQHASVMRNAVNPKPAPKPQSIPQNPRESAPLRPTERLTTSRSTSNATTSRQPQRVNDQRSSLASGGYPMNASLTTVRPNTTNAAASESSSRYSANLNNQNNRLPRQGGGVQTPHSNVTADAGTSVPTASTTTQVMTQSKTSTNSPLTSAPTSSQPPPSRNPPLVNKHGPPQDKSLANPRAIQELDMTSTAPHDTAAAINRAPWRSGTESNPRSQASARSLRQMAPSAPSAQRPVSSGYVGGALQGGTVDNAATPRADVPARVPQPPSNAPRLPDNVAKELQCVKQKIDAAPNRRVEIPEGPLVFRPISIKSEPEQKPAPVTTFPQQVESQNAARQGNAGARSAAEARASVSRPQNTAGTVPDRPRSQINQPHNAPPLTAPRALRRASPSYGPPDPRPRPLGTSLHRTDSNRSGRRRSPSPRDTASTGFARPVPRPGSGGGRPRDYPSPTRSGDRAPISWSAYYQRPLLDSWTPSYPDSTRNNRRPSPYGSGRRRSLSPPNHPRYRDSSRDYPPVKPEHRRQYERQETVARATYSDTYSSPSSHRNSLASAEGRKGPSHIRFDSDASGTALPQGQEGTVQSNNETRAIGRDGTGGRTAPGGNPEPATSSGLQTDQRQDNNGFRDVGQRQRVADQHPTAAASAPVADTPRHQAQQMEEYYDREASRQQSSSSYQAKAQPTVRQNEAVNVTKGSDATTKSSNQPSTAETSSQSREDSGVEIQSTNAPVVTVSNDAASSQSSKANPSNASPTSHRPKPASVSLPQGNPPSATQPTAPLPSTHSATQSVGTSSGHTSSSVPTARESTAAFGSHNLIQVQTQKLPKPTHPASTAPATAAVSHHDASKDSLVTSPQQPPKIKTEEGVTTHSPQVVPAASSEFVTSNRPARTSVPPKSEPSETVGISGIPDHDRSADSNRATTAHGTESVTAVPSPTLNPSNRLKTRISLPSRSIESQSAPAATRSEGSAAPATPPNVSSRQRPSLFSSGVDTAEAARNLFTDADKVNITDVTRWGRFNLVCTFTSLENASAAYSRLPKERKTPLRPGQKRIPKVQWFEERPPRSAQSKVERAPSGGAELGSGEQQAPTAGSSSRADDRRTSVPWTDDAFPSTGKHAAQSSNTRDVRDQQGSSNHQANTPRLADTPPIPDPPSRSRTGDPSTRNNDPRDGSGQNSRSIEQKYASSSRTYIRFADSESTSNIPTSNETQEFSIKDRSDTIPQDDSYGISIRGHATMPKPAPVLSNMPSLSARFDAMQPPTLQGFDLHRSNTYISGYSITGSRPPALYDIWRDNTHSRVISPSPVCGNSYAVKAEPPLSDSSHLPDIPIRGAANRERRHTFQPGNDGRHEGYRIPMSPPDYTGSSHKSLETRVSFRRPS